MRSAQTCVNGTGQAVQRHGGTCVEVWEDSLRTLNLLEENLTAPLVAHLVSVEEPSLSAASEWRVLQALASAAHLEASKQPIVTYSGIFVNEASKQKLIESVAGRALAPGWAIASELHVTLALAPQTIHPQVPQPTQSRSQSVAEWLCC